MAKMISGVAYPLFAINGTGGAPSYTFASEPTTGFFRVSAGNVGLSILGTSRHQWAAAQYSLLNDAAVIALGAAQDCQLLRDGAADTWAFQRSTNQQTVRIYATTTGAKYLSLTHNGVNATIDQTVAGGALNLNPTGQTFFLGNGDCQLSRSVSNACGILNWNLGSTLNASPADQPLQIVAPNFGGAFTITRMSYFKLLNPAGAATITDAPILHFDNVPGTHKALAANGSVATVLGSVGPTGAATTVQGWLKWNINGTIRYTPFF